MKIFTKIIISTIIVLLSFQCKKESATSPDLEETPQEIIDQHKINDQFISYLRTKTLDSALILTMEWAQQQPYVKSARRKTNGIAIEYSSGIKGAIVFYMQDHNGQISIKGFHGLAKSSNNQDRMSGKNKRYNANRIKAQSHGILDETIGNKKAYIWAPFEFRFKVDMRPPLEAIINNADVKLELTTRSDGHCTVSSFRDALAYGLVIIDSHGSEGNYILTGEEFTLENYETYLSWFSNGMLEVWDYNIMDSTGRNVLEYHSYWVIENSFISSLSGTFPNSVIFNGSCESTWSDSLEKAFINKGAKTYFGFDTTVTTTFSSATASQIVDALVNMYWNTGEAFVPGMKDLSVPEHTEFEMKGSTEMSYAMPRWEGEFHFLKKIDTTIVDGNETRAYHINYKADFSFKMICPEDVALYNPYYFENDSIAGLYSRSYSYEITNQSYHDLCIALCVGTTEKVMLFDRAWLDIDPDSNKYSFQIMFLANKTNDCIATCSGGTNYALNYLEFIGSKSEWYPGLEYPMEGTINDSVISGKWVGPGIEHETEINSNGLEGVTLEWNFVRK